MCDSSVTVDIDWVRSVGFVRLIAGSIGSTVSTLQMMPSYGAGLFAVLAGDPWGRVRKIFSGGEGTGNERLARLFRSYSQGGHMAGD